MMLRRLSACAAAAAGLSAALAHCKTGEADGLSAALAQCGKDDAAGRARTAGLSAALAHCETGMAGRTESSTFGQNAEGRPIMLRCIENGSLKVKVMDFGATITSVLTPDQAGVPGEITLGFDDAKPYVDGRSPYFGCVAGRVANRIAGGKFTLLDAEYSLATNNGKNHLHGGKEGFDKKLWTCEEHTPTSITLALFSPDGEEGYPSNLLARVTYSLPSPNQLKIVFSAVADGTTPVNLTNHTYWNLADGGRTPCTNHSISLNANYYTPVDDSSIPTGEIRRVDCGSGAMDLRTPIAIGAKLADADQGMGYDHNYVLGAPSIDGLRDVATVTEPSSGRTMRVRTDQPGVQFYTGGKALLTSFGLTPHTHFSGPHNMRMECSGNYLNGLVGRDGVSYGRHHGFCLETQKFPDSVNHPHFPSVVLAPGQKYVHTTTHDFGVVA